MLAGRPGPPVEVGVRLDGLRMEAAAALGDDGLEVGKGGEVPVGDRLVDQGPEMLGRLRFRAVGRQEDEADPLGDGQALGPVPAGVVEHEDDVALAPGAGFPREAGEQRLEEGLGEAAAEIPDRLAAGRLHEGDHVQPLVAVVAKGDRPLADGRPDPAPDRLQAEAVLILGPDLDRAVGVFGRGLRDRLVQLFSAPPAARGLPSGDAAAAGPGPTTRAASAPPSRVADAPPPDRDAAPSRRPPWGRSTARHLRAAPSAARPRRRARPRSAGWRPCRCAAAGRPAPRGRRRWGAPPAASPSAARRPAPPRPPARCAPAPAARSPASAAPRSRPARPGTAPPVQPWRDARRSAPWCRSRTTALQPTPARPTQESSGQRRRSPGFRMTVAELTALRDAAEAKRREKLDDAKNAVLEETRAKLAELGLTLEAVLQSPASAGQGSKR